MSLPHLCDRHQSVSSLFKPLWVGGGFILLLGVCSLTGCEALGFIAYVFGGGDRAKMVTVAAQYRGLENRSVAVLVNADEYVFFEHPQVPAAMGQTVSRELGLGIEGVRVLDRKQVHAYEKQNPYWSTLAYRQVFEQLNVERLLLIDLVKYAHHEPGNRHIWQGTIVANVAVAQADAQNPDDRVYATTIQVKYPPNSSVGLVNSNTATIQALTLRLFAQKVADCFREHEVERK